MRSAPSAPARTVDVAAAGSSAAPPAPRAAAPGAPRWSERTLVETSTADAECHVRVTSFELSGLADAALQRRLNEAFSPRRLAVNVWDRADPEATSDAACGPGGALCDDTQSGRRILCRRADGARAALYYDATVKPTLLDERVLSARREYGFDGGGAHPSDGVDGVTIDLRGGRPVGAGELLADPEHPPDWATLVPADHFAKIAGGSTPVDVDWGVDVWRRPQGLELPWSDFYLVPEGIALVPRVPEVARIYRHTPVVVPFAKLSGHLAAEGPAAHLYRR